MKKLFFVTAALVATMSINAAVVDIDLSKAQSTSSSGSATLAYDDASGVLTVNWTVNTGWEVSGVNIPLRSITGITGLQFEFQGNGEKVDFLHYFVDEQGNQWWDDNGWYNLENTEWTSASLTPYKALWSTPSYEYGASPMLGLRFVANPEFDNTSGTFKLRNVKLVTSGENIGPNPEGQSLPLTYKGEVLPINTDFSRNMSGQVGKNLKIPLIKISQ